VIASLEGKLIYKVPDTVIIDVRGVGYEIKIPLSTYYNLPEPDEQTRLHIHTCIKDDAIILNGFLSAEEKEIFLHLISVTGIGPKLARNILSGISVDDFKASVVAKELPVLVKVPGLGKKTAERLILELSDKLGLLVTDTSESASFEQKLRPLDEDVVSALVNLGYKEQQAREAQTKAKAALNDDSSFEESFKSSLKLLSGK
jgi:Holliday junction DNA helicase RuvA